MEKLVRHIAESLVDDPSAVEVNVKEDTDTIRIYLTVASGDMGRLIGKSGKTANALRTVCKAVGAKTRKKIYVDIQD